MATPCGELLKSEDKFRLGETVEIKIDWDQGFHRGKRFQITGFQMNGTTECARGFWKGKYARKMSEEYGILFPLLDLKKIEKTA